MSRPPAAIAPSGLQIPLRHGDQLAIVTSVGATLRQYQDGGGACIDGFAADRSSDSRGQLLIPWPNRIGEGRYRFGGEEHTLPITDRAHGAAIHGLVRWVEWRVDRAEVALAALSTTLYPQPGYEFCLHCEVTYRLDADGLSVRSAATNVGRGPLPVGIGAHPYLAVGTASIDTAVLTVPAGRYLPVGADLLPAGPARPVAGTPYDFRTGRRIGPAALDVALTDLIPDGSGRTTVELAAPGATRRVALWADSACRYIQLYTGDTLPDPAVRRRGLAVEPMTCAPDAFRSGAGLRVLVPGERLTAAFGIRAR